MYIIHIASTEGVRICNVYHISHINGIIPGQSTYLEHLFAYHAYQLTQIVERSHKSIKSVHLTFIFN